MLNLDLNACKERKNVNLPGVIVDLPTLTKKDEEDLVNWGIPNDIDFIAASFVRKGQDLDNIRKACSLSLSSSNDTQWPSIRICVCPTAPRLNRSTCKARSKEEVQKS